MEELLVEIKEKVAVWYKERILKLNLGNNLMCHPVIVLGHNDFPHPWDRGVTNFFEHHLPSYAVLCC